MGKNTSFTLGEHFPEFVDDRVRSGRYNTVSDVVRAGLRLLEAEEAKLEALQSALIKGEQSGPSRPFDFCSYVSRKRNGTA